MQGGDDKGNAKESAAARDNLIYKMQGSDDEEDAKEAAAANHNLIYKSQKFVRRGEAQGGVRRCGEVRAGKCSCTKKKLVWKTTQPSLKKTIK